MRTVSLAALLALPGLLACNGDDPCAKYDTGICGKKEGCEVFLATAMGNTSGSWCKEPSAVSEGQVCMTSPEPDCEIQKGYASPPDEEGNATDACYSYTGCQAPQGWVDCDPGVGLTVIECDGS